MNNHRKLSFRPPEALTTTETGRVIRKKYKKFQQPGPDKTITHISDKYSNESREELIERILNMNV